MLIILGTKTGEQYMKQHQTQPNKSRPNVKPLVHWAIYKKYILRFKKREPTQVTGILKTAQDTLSFKYNPQTMSIDLPTEKIFINEHGWELEKIVKAEPNYSELIQQLEYALSQDLPGKIVQYEMAPKPRTDSEIGNQPPKNARAGGVLALIYPHNQQFYIPLILRPSYKGVHSGQVSFPGGGHEEKDKNITATALREAHEEIGIQPNQVHILGKLTPLYIAPSNYLVHATVGWSNQRPDYCIDTHEVAQLIESPLTELLNPSNRRQERWTLRNRETDVPYFAVQNQTIWGATAMLLNELISLTPIKNI